MTVYVRKFLNLKGHHTTAAILAEINPGDKNCTLDISDCNRTISLEFDLWTAFQNDTDFDTRKAKANALYKIDVLYKTIRDFRRVLYRILGEKPREL